MYQQQYPANTASHQMYQDSIFLIVKSNKIKKEKIFILLLIILVVVVIIIAIVIAVDVALANMLH